MASGNYTILVDETGIDGRSKRVMYIGCLIDTSELSNLEEMVIKFNRACLDDPFYSYKPGLVNSAGEPRHFADDNEALRSRFIEQVIYNVPCRVYGVFDKPHSTVRESRVAVFKKFIALVQEVREIKKLNVIIESSGIDDKHLEECGATYRSKDYLPLSIVDYFGAVMHRFHEQRLALLDSGDKIEHRKLNGLWYGHYSALVDRISFETDLSTRERSSRRNGRYFLKQIDSIVKKD